MACFEKTSLKYDQISFYRKRWFIVLSLIFFAPLSIPIMLTGDVFAKRQGGVYRFGSFQKVILLLIAVAFSFQGISKLIQYSNQLSSSKIKSNGSQYQYVDEDVGISFSIPNGWKILHLKEKAKKDPLIMIASDSKEKIFTVSELKLPEESNLPEQVYPYSRLDPKVAHGLVGTISNWINKTPGSYIISEEPGYFADLPGIAVTLSIPGFVQGNYQWIFSGEKGSKAQKLMIMKITKSSSEDLSNESFNEIESSWQWR